MQNRTMTKISNYQDHRKHFTYMYILGQYILSIERAKVTGQLHFYFPLFQEIRAKITDISTRIAYILQIPDGLLEPSY